MDAFIAKRELSYQDEAGSTYTIHLQVGKPFPDETGVWCCEYQLGVPLTIFGKAHGQDSLQALILCLCSIRARLEAKEFRGKIDWLGQEDLGLPSIRSDPNMKYLEFLGTIMESSPEDKEHALQTVEKELHRLKRLKKMIQKYKS